MPAIVHIMSPMKNILPRSVRDGLEPRNIPNYDGTESDGLDVIDVNELNELQQTVD